MDERLNSGCGAAACSTPAGLRLVDAAFERSGGAEAQLLRKTYCPTCPIVEECLRTGMLGEWGVWGGTGQHVRTKQGMPKPMNRRGQVAS